MDRPAAAAALAPDQTWLTADYKPGQTVTFGAKGWHGVIVGPINDDELVHVWYTIRRSDGVVVTVIDVDIRPAEIRRP